MLHKDVFMKKPELLAPAGDMERLRAAVLYGADAVYLGGKIFGMRSNPANFGEDELKEAVRYCHDRGVKVYLTCNVLPRNNELSELPDFLKKAKDAEVDAFIISDLGVLEYAKKYAPEVEIHISTQAGIVNFAAANAFVKMGAKRIVTARELSMNEIKELRANIPKDIDIECFVHGAMCVSFSGRCLISNYLVGRDSNRGECAQPCRWKYSLVEEKRPGQYFPINEENGGTYIMNSRDMCMIEHIPEMIKSGITSFKIEGRAKSAYYVAIVTNAYRKAIDEYFENPSDDFMPSQWVLDEMHKVSYRDYCTGFYYGDPSFDANISYKGGYNREWDVVAVVEKCENGFVYCTQRNRFFASDEVEILEPSKEPFKVRVERIFDEEGNEVPSTNKAMMKFSFECDRDILPQSLIRIQKSEPERVII